MLISTVNFQFDVFAKVRCTPCHVCLNRADNLTLDVRAWTCKHCGTHHDRDVNAAINIRNEALRILALGTSASACGGDVSRQE
ncbi:zinc ribbon domain-containing protein [Microcoleus sp. A2-C2]|uniref:zinc ribbon domain-containing protein n=1 Tax=unclassified Microcoleus TaxID=2642155 RepID=UPI003FA5CC68